MDMQGMRGETEMTAAAIAAQLVDMRNVGTHKVLKLTIHIPEEQALAAIAAFGWPTGVDPVPIAIARMKTEKEVMPPESTKQSTETPPRQQETVDGAKTPTCQPPYGENCTEPFNWDDGVPYCDTCGRFRSNEAHHRVAKAPKTKTAWRDMRLANQAGILCDKPAFQKFLTETYSDSHNPFTAESAVLFVRDHCGVKSRSHISPFATRGAKWKELFNEYSRWMHEPEMVA